MKNVIFTADDYGAIEQIDVGVREAVRQRRINSVAVFPNGPGAPYGYWRTSLEELVRAGNEAREHDEDYRLQIGIHLTLTSGWAVDPASELGETEIEHGQGRRSQRFYGIDNFRFDVSYGDVSREFKAQLAQLERALDDVQSAVPNAERYRVTNLSTHHNVHLFREPIFNAFVDLARDQRIPIRSHVVVPRARAWAYFLRTRFRTHCDNDPSFRRTVGRFYRRLKRKPTEMAKGVARPDTFDVTHTGPIPVTRVQHEDVPRLAETKRGRLLDELRENDRGAQVHEFVFHLVDENDEALIPSVAEGWVCGYPGVDHQLIDSRLVEQTSLLGLDDGNLRQVQNNFARWSELRHHRKGGG